MKEAGRFGRRFLIVTVKAKRSSFSPFIISIVPLLRVNNQSLEHGISVAIQGDFGREPRSRAPHLRRFFLSLLERKTLRCRI